MRLGMKEADTDFAGCAHAGFDILRSLSSQEKNKKVLVLAASSTPRSDARASQIAFTANNRPRYGKQDFHCKHAACISLCLSRLSP